jgi:hypothetical protein
VPGGRNEVGDVPHTEHCHPQVARVESLANMVLTGGSAHYRLDELLHRSEAKPHKGCPIGPFLTPHRVEETVVQSRKIPTRWGGFPGALRPYRVVVDPREDASMNLMADGTMTLVS